MKTLTIERFKTLLKTDNWTHEQHIETSHTDTVSRIIDNESIDIDQTHGYSTLTSKCGDVDVLYTECWQHHTCDPDSFETYDSHKTWSVNTEIVDDDGVEIDPEDHGCFDDLPRFSAIDYDEFTSDIDQTDDIDGDIDMTIKQHIVQIDNKPNLRFNGEVVAGATSKSPDNDVRWTELALFKTTGGKYVCEQIGRTVYQGESNFYDGCVCEATAEVIKYFGFGWLAKELYAYAGIEAVQDVE